MWVEIIQFMEGLNSTNKAEKGHILFSLLELRCGTSIFSSLQTSELLVLVSISGIYTNPPSAHPSIHSPILCPSASSWDLHHQLPLFSSC